MAKSHVQCEVNDGIALVTFARSDKLNALDNAMIDAIIAVGDQLNNMRSLRCVVIYGEGRAFCAGLDVSMFASFLSPDSMPMAQRTHGNANRFQHAALQWRTLPVPVIAAVHGLCFGGGLQIAAAADLRIVAPDTRLSVMELKWGIIPDLGGFALWRGVVREDILRELTYTAREFSGEEALEWGFATHNDLDPLARAMTIARDIAGKSPNAIRAAKTLFNAAQAMNLDEILLAESVAQDNLIGSTNQLEAVQSGMAKRPPRFIDP